MTPNGAYLKSTPGILKLINIVAISVAVILGYCSYFLSEYTGNRKDYAHLFTDNELRSLWREIYMLGVVTICLLCSVINLGLHCWSLELYWKTKTAYYDFIYHSLAAIFLATSGLLFIVSAVKIYNVNCTTENGCQEFELKLAAGAISMMTSLVFGVTGTIVMTNRKDVERERLWSDKS